MIRVLGEGEGICKDLGQEEKWLIHRIKKKSVSMVQRIRGNMVRKVKRGGLIQIMQLRICFFLSEKQWEVIEGVYYRYLSEGSGQS